MLVKLTYTKWKRESMSTELQLVGNKSWGATAQPGDHTHRGALHISELNNRIYKVPPINKC